MNLCYECSFAFCSFAASRQKPIVRKYFCSVRTECFETFTISLIPFTSSTSLSNVIFQRFMLIERIVMGRIYAVSHCTSKLNQLSFRYQEKIFPENIELKQVNLWRRVKSGSQSILSVVSRFLFLITIQ